MNEITIGDWMQRYLDYSKTRHVKKTYDEKKSSFQTVLSVS
jgi:hypothetical protein